MARRSPLTLADLTPVRGPPSSGVGPLNHPVEPERQAGRQKEERVRRGQTLRLEPEAWKQLKLLAIDQGKTSHDLLIEAVNLLFDRYNRPTIAG